MSFRIIHALIVALLFMLSGHDGATYAAQLEINLTKTTNTYSGSWRDSESSRQKTTVSEEQIVKLTPSKISVRTGEIEQIHDFAALKTFHISHTDKTYLPVSMHWVPSFFEVEGQNRDFLRHTSKAMGLDHPVIAVELEMLFEGDAQSDVATHIVRKDSDVGSRFSYLDEEITAFQLSDTSVPASLQQAYLRYIAREHRIHPATRDLLVQKNTIFRVLEYAHRYEGIGSPEYRFELTASTISDVENVDVPGDYILQDYPEPLNEIAELNRSRQPKTIEEYAESMMNALAVGDLTSAFLAFGEYDSHYGDDGIEAIRPLIREVMERRQRGSELDRLIKAIDENSREKEPRLAAIEVIEEAMPNFENHAHVLKAYVANHYAATGNLRKSTDLFYDVLRENPFMTRAYGDLGGKYFQLFELPQAWMVWAEMRRLNPDHPYARQLEPVEKGIRDRNPAFF